MNPIGCIGIMNPLVTSLLEFNEAFEIPKLDTPGLGTDEMIELRIKLLKEEVEEYAEAARAGDMVEVLDALATLDTSLQAPSSITACRTSMMMRLTKSIAQTWRNWSMARSSEEKTVKCSNQKVGSPRNLHNFSKSEQGVGIIIVGPQQWP